MMRCGANIDISFNAVNAKKVIYFFMRIRKNDYRYAWEKDC